MAKKAESDRKRKATETAKEARWKSKYAKMDNSEAAQKAYSRHDDGAVPDEVTDDVLPDFLKEMMSYYNTKVRVTKDSWEIEQNTQQQAASERWKHGKSWWNSQNEENNKKKQEGKRNSIPHI